MNCKKCTKRNKDHKETKEILSKFINILFMAFFALGAVINAAVWFVIVQHGTVAILDGQRNFMFLWAALLTIYLGYAYVKTTESETK